MRRVPYHRATFEALTVKELTTLYKAAKDAFFNSDKPLMNDADFDLLEAVLRERSPKSPALRIVGPATTPARAQPVKLPVYMGSLEKIKPDGSASKYLAERVSTGFTVSDKLDGNAVLIENRGQQNPALPRGKPYSTYWMYSRGKGVYGFDISVLLPAIRGVGRLRKNEMVRGELVVTNTLFRRWDKALNEGVGYENPRNLTSGIVNRAAQSQAVHEAAGDATFYVHSAVSPERSLPSVGASLEAAGWTVVPYRQISGREAAAWLARGIEEELHNYLLQRKGSVDYDMDGLVLTLAGGAAVAFKGNDEEAVAEVAEVVWNASRYGVLKPVATFVQGVRLAGVTVTRATAHNAANVQELGIGPGAKITIIRAGEVIPKIVGSVTPAEPQFPPAGTWRWNATRVDLLIKAGTKAVDDAVKVQRIISFVAAMEFEHSKLGIRLGQATKLVAGGLDNPLRLVHASEARLRRTGIGPAAAKKLYAGLREGLATSTHLDMMYASGVFPRGWGYERLARILNAYPYSELQELAAGSTEDFQAALAHVGGFKRRLLSQLQPALKRYAIWISRMGWLPEVEHEPPVEIVGPLSGSNVAFTKIRSAADEARIVALGGKIGSVNAQTRWVVAPAGASSEKLKRAQVKSIAVVTLEQLQAELAKLERKTRRQTTV